MNDVGPVTAETVFNFMSELLPGLPPRIKALTLHLAAGEPALVTVTYTPDVQAGADVNEQFHLVSIPKEVADE